MSGVLGSAPKTNVAPSYTAFRLQTSAYGLPIPLIYGMTRVAGNIAWYANFTAVAHKTGGKGGLTGGGGKSGGTSYTYAVDLLVSLGEGPIAGVATVWVSQTGNSLANMMPGASLSPGNYGQAPWGGLPSNQALGYSGIAYVAAAQFGLGASPALPNLTFEVQGIGYAAAANGIDADPAAVAADLLANPHYGAGFPTARLGSLSDYQAWCRASGLWISPAYTQQASAASLLEEIARFTHAEWVWSSGLLTLVPRGAVAVAGNGASWSPPPAPVFDLDDEDFLPNAGAAGDDPVILTRARAADQLNHIQIECLDRANLYAATTAEWTDQALLQRYGRRSSGAQAAHLFADLGAAQVAVQLLGQEQYNRNTYAFTLPAFGATLAPMDIVTLTDPILGLARQWVRVISSQEQDDGSWAIEAEEYPYGTGAAAAYRINQGWGYTPNYGVAPGPINPPVIFEAPIVLTESGGLEIWAGVSGSSPYWGGANVWVSLDGTTYSQLAAIKGPARMGVLSAPIGAGTDPDTTDTLAVDLTESRAQLLSGSTLDADSGATACYVDGECIAYSTATLTATYQYALSTYLRRGQYGSFIAPHPAGSAFVRLDQNVGKVPISQPQLGQTLWLKFQSVNIWGGGAESLDSLAAYTHVITGAPANFVIARPFATAGLSSITLSWVNPPASLYSLAAVEIWRNTANDRNSATHIGDAAYPATTYVDGGLQSGHTYYYWLRPRDVAGNPGLWTEVITSTASKIQAGDLAQGAVTIDAFTLGISPIVAVDALPAPSGYRGPPVVFLNSDGQLYRYASGRWTAEVPAPNITGGITADQIAPATITAANLAINKLLGGPVGTAAPGVGAIGALAAQAGAVTADQIAGGAVTAAQLAGGAVQALHFARGLSPIQTVSALPDPAGYTGPPTVLMSTDGTLYRYAAGAWTAAVAAANVTGQLSDAQVAAISAAKITGQLSDAQVAAISAAKVTGQITGTQISNGAIATPQLAAGAVTAAALAAGAVTAGSVAAGAVQASSIAAGAVTTAAIAAGAVQAGQIATGAISADKMAANSVTAAALAAGAITANAIQAGAVTTAALAAGAVTAGQIATGTISADKMAANSVTAAALAANAVTANAIEAGAVSAAAIAASSIYATHVVPGSIGDIAFNYFSGQADLVAVGLGAYQWFNWQTSPTLQLDPSTKWLILATCSYGLGVPATGISYLQMRLRNNAGVMVSAANVGESNPSLGSYGMATLVWVVSGGSGTDNFMPDVCWAGNQPSFAIVQNRLAGYVRLAR